MLDAGLRDVRNQGVLLNGVNADPHALLDLCFRLLDGAQIMPYYFYMCDMIPFSEHWRVSLADAQRLQHHIMGYLPGFATPRIVCDVPFVGKRWVHQNADYDTEHGISYWTKNYRTSIEADRRRGPLALLRVLRPDPHPPRGRPAVVGAARAPRRGRRSRPPRWPRRRAVPPPSRPGRSSGASARISRHPASESPLERGVRHFEACATASRCRTTPTQYDVLHRLRRAPFRQPAVAGTSSAWPSSSCPSPTSCSGAS